MSEINRAAEKYNFLPSINSNITHGYNWGQTIDPFTNQFATSRVQYNNFSLSSSVTLFSGLQNQRNRQLASVRSEIAKTELELQKRDLSIEIMTAFLQAKLNEAMAILQTKHLDLTTSQLEKATILVEHEYETRRYLLELETQQKKEAYQLTLAKNDWTQSIHLIQTLIGLDYDSSFVLNDSIFILQSLNGSETDLNDSKAERQLYQISLAKASLSPRLTLNGFIGTGYSGNNLYVTSNGELAPKPFGTQVNENLYQSASLNLSIPIFAGSKSYANIKIAKLEYQRVLIENDERDRQLQSRTLGLQLDVQNQIKALEAAKAVYTSSENLFREAEIQLSEGVIDYYTFLRSKDALFTAEAELVQAKFRLRFAELVLELID